MTPGSLAALRGPWQALCAAPDRDDLAAALSAPLHAALDAGLAALRAATTDLARAAAIGRSLAAALALQLARERKPYVPGPYALELRRRLSGLPEDDDADTDADDGEGPEPEPDPGDPFLAWRLGDRARDAPDGERDAWVDRAIAAFDAIALQPIDPGNDLGPFTRFVHVMREDQVRRAIAVTERMAGADWGLELCHARAYLFVRLAALGHVDEAALLVARIGDRPLERAALGAIVGHRVRLGMAWSLPADTLAGDDALHVISGLCEALPDPPEALVLRCLDLACALPGPQLRDHAFEVLVSAWAGVGPAARWSAALRDFVSEEPRIESLLALAAARRSEAPEFCAQAVELLAAQANPLPWVDGLVAVRVHVPLRVAVEVFAASMDFMGRTPRTWLLRDLHYTYGFEDLLRWLAGDAGLSAAAGGLDEVFALLA